MMTMVISGSDGVTFPDSTNQFSGGAFSFKNRLINGGMVIDQRNAGASVTGNDGVFGVDRWVSIATQTSKYTMQQNAGSVTPPAGFSNYLGVVSSSAFSVGSTDFFQIRQRIEGFNTSDLAFGTASAKAVTLSFWVRSSLTGAFGGSINNSAFDRSYPFSYTISAANTWEYKTVTIAGDTSGTWLGGNNTGIQIGFSLGSGTSMSGTAGSWSGSGFAAPTGATSVVGTNGATFYITGVQLEVGSVATPFERRPFGTELALCQRYYQRIAASESSFAVAGRWGANIIGFTLPTPVTLRAQPTISSSGTFTVIGNGSSENFTSPALGSWSGSLLTLIKSGLTLNPSTTAAYFVYVPGVSPNFVAFSSEL
jgi:hypothetical protein